jgi:hypothetical protein
VDEQKRGRPRSDSYAHRGLTIGASLSSTFTWNCLNWPQIAGLTPATGPRRARTGKNLRNFIG